MEFGVVAILAWLGLGLWCIRKEKPKPPRTYPGCCDDCGHVRCPVNPMCRKCENRSVRWLPDDPPPPTGSPYR